MTKYQPTTALRKIAALSKRVRVIQGGSSAGKTIAVLLLLINRAQTENGLLISVVSATIPHLKKGAIRDFQSIMESHGYWRDDCWNATDFVFSFPGTKSRLEFFSADSPDKVRGPRRNVLFINEANNIPYETYTQLAIRTDGEIFLDYNPVSEFWAHTELTGHDFLILTYKDNESLPEGIVKEIESRKDNKRFWTVYGLGLVGSMEGRIYQGWKVIDEVPFEARLERYGLDFGYTNDPSAIVAVYYHNGGYILDEIEFSKGLSNKQIADRLLNEPKALVIADSAEPKSIAEIKMYGIPIVGALKQKTGTKAESYVKWSIGVVQEQKMSVTKRSVNILKEYQNYGWLLDKEGKPLNVPDHLWSHSMDALRYAITSFEHVQKRKEMAENRFYYPSAPKTNIAV